MMSDAFVTKKMKLFLFQYLVLIAVIAAFGFGFKVYAEEADPPSEPMAYQSEPVTPGVFEGNLRNLPKAKAWRQSDSIIEIPRRIYPRPEPHGNATEEGEPGIDPLLEINKDTPLGSEGECRNFSTPELNFEGQGFTGARPPDTVGEIGPNHYIQMVNDSGGSIFNIYDKTTGALVVGPAELDSLWTAGGACASGYGDPVVLYDTLADRWLMSEFALAGNHLCVYISQTSDPVSGGWYLYDFGVPQFPDYPKYAVWSDAYYVTTNESSPAVYALERDQMLNGLTATFQRFTAPSLPGFGFQALTPGDLDGSTAPPAGSPNYFIRHKDNDIHGNPADPDVLEIWEFSVDWNNSANSTFTGPTNIQVTEFDSNLGPAWQEIPQPGTSTQLDAIREVVMWRSQYRNFGTHETLVGNFVTDVDGTDHAGIRWFELRNSGGGWTLFQEGTYAPDEAHRWLGSIAMDQDGNIALGYSVSSTSIYPSIRYAGRLASDPPGTMPRGEYTLIDGSGSQTGSTRWGDYSSMNVDPTDDSTFWYTNEYIGDDGYWQTRIGSFSFAESSSIITQTLIPPDETTVAPGEDLGPFGMQHTNNSDASVDFYVQHYLIKPDGTAVWSIQRPASFAAGKTRRHRFILSVPSWSEAGDFTWGTLLTDTSGNELDDDSFDFTVVADGQGLKSSQRLRRLMNAPGAQAIKMDGWRMIILP